MDIGNNSQILQLQQSPVAYRNKYKSEPQWKLTWNWTGSKNVGKILASKLN